MHDGQLRSSPWCLWLLPAALLWAVACAPQAAPAAPAAKAPAAQAPAGAPAAAQPGKAALDDLVSRARQEGELVAAIQSSWNQALIPPLSDAFKKRFGLNINVSLTNITAAQHVPIAVAETRTGAPATYDAMQGDDAETMQLVGAEGAQRIEGWEALLAEVNPLVGSGKVRPDEISHGPFAGRSLAFMSNVKQILYNPRVITDAELPRLHADLADARYDGKFTQPPWTAHWEIAPAALDNLNREQWLDVVRAAGKNTGAVLGESAGVQRVVLGQFAFGLAQDTYVRQTLAKDPQAPIAFKYFADYNEANTVYYSVRTGARHPAAAALWVLWMTTPEAQGIWQPSELQGQRYGDSEIDRQQAQSIKDSGAKVVGFLDTPKTIDLLEWYQTADGAKYLEAMTKAIKGE